MGRFKNAIVILLRGGRVGREGTGRWKEIVAVWKIIRMGEERDARDLKMSGGGRRVGNSEMAVGETLYYLGHVGPDNIET